MEKQSEQGSNNQQQQQLDSFAPLDGAAPDQDQIIGGGAGAEMVDYMLGQQTPPPPPPPHGHVSSFDKLSFSDVLHFADFGPRLALNQPLSTHHPADSDNDEDSYFFRFQPSLPAAEDSDDPTAQHAAVTTQGSGGDHGTVGGGVSESTTTLVQPQQQQQETVGGGKGGGGGGAGNKSGRRKRPRSTKTSEEVESQRMTHIAVERNRRRQMNDYLRVLRSLMPGSYVQRGDQASIIGGAIEFIRELEQLIQCLESQKRRRLYGDAPRPTAPDISTGAGAPPVVPPPATSSMLQHEQQAAPHRGARAGRRRRGQGPFPAPAGAAHQDHRGPRGNALVHPTHQHHHHRPDRPLLLQRQDRRRAKIHGGGHRRRRPPDP